MSNKVVHIVGTGTIGEPLIGLFSDFKDELGINEVTFHKNTPLLRDRSKVGALIRRGAKLTTSEETKDGFIIKGFKLVEGINGLFVGFPSQKGSDDEYYDTVWADRDIKELVNQLY